MSLNRGWTVLIPFQALWGGIVVSAAAGADSQAAWTKLTAAFNKALA